MVFLFLVLDAGVTHAQVVWFEKTFSSQGVDSTWSSSSGEWAVREGAVRIQTRDYDCLLANSFYVFEGEPYSLEVVLRGIRTGVFFSLDDRRSKALSHMVRFDEKNVLTGYFSGGGEYRATNTFDAPVLQTSWTTLRIDIDPFMKKYEVFVNGVSIGVDTNLVFSSGYIGLQASDGVSEFRSVRLFAAGPFRKPKVQSLGTPAVFRHVRFVKSQGKNLVIGNAEHGLLQTMDENGRIIEQNSIDRLPAVNKQVAIGDRTFTIEKTVIVVRDARGAVVDSLSDRIVAPFSLLTEKIGNVNVLFVSDPGAGTIMQFDSQGRFLKEFRARSIGGFKGPLGFDFYDENEIVVADYDRLVFVERTMEEVDPVVEKESPTEVTVSWDRKIWGDQTIECAADGGVWRTYGRGSKDGMSKSFRLTGLKPLTRYSYSISPTLRTIPEARARTRILRFSTPPTDLSMMAYTRLPLMYMVYRNVSYRDKYPRNHYPEIPDGRTLTDEEITSLKEAVMFNREFFFRNSSCLLVLDFDFYVVEDTLRLSEIGDRDPYWLSPNERVARDFEHASAFFEKKPEEYAGLVVPYAWVNYPPRRASALSDPSRTDSVTIRQAFGGGTYGVPAPWRYGKTAGYTANPFQDRFSRQDWLITHEFHHQLDALMEASGFAEYFHCDLPWKMPGRFGEDFDFNARILRLAPLGWWTALGKGRLSVTRDSDHDGLPDDDPTLPFDERRLGGNPSKNDTDMDGLQDLGEVMAGSLRGSHLNVRDTDADGMLDRFDAEPLYPTKPILAKVSGERDLTRRYLGSISASDLDADLFAGWDDEFLYFEYEADTPAHLLLQIDANADGWFHGFDNFQIRILSYEDSMKVASFYLRDCSSWVSSPKDRNDLLKQTDLKVHAEKRSYQVAGRAIPRRIRGAFTQTPIRQDRYILVVKVPRNDRYGLELRSGKKIAFRVGLQKTVDLWVWNELFEKNYMMQVELQ